ncbi:HAD-superfamily hydrolase, subfamily IA, variant 3 [Ruminiclostridium papyrosolvens DSM 2782]|uniref:HAD-superfamily hydrolase, subfamily IA, variant 3 n=1 Tax=Ruminiclostridium papyrosolvens DSM 2782 TaxID=588581 RepID=F1T797_9FIRM|nr:HAD family phosphatase [Ruminiclostridium papyrosolvens]EGD49345.1 HAD-superfamily hydrolase, subfamily IA, variant 3 [Ruminiclostridium papyrosolvens DSM 2782]WES33528.1 HAD family phosphatase [Ruminiclostridium papyrosolvens DSM 2782]
MNTVERKKDLVIFDVDGVIFDSEPLHYRAKLEILQSYGLNETFNLKEYVGKPNKDLWTKIIKENNLNANQEELELRQFNLILDYVKKQKIQPTNGLEQLLSELKKNNYKIAIASSSNRYYISRVLEYFHISGYFDYSVTGDEVKFQKPSPDIYQKVLSISGIKKDSTIAIEDSASGVRAAASAGITCIGYRNLTSGVQDLFLADAIIQELIQVKNYI